MGRPRHGLDGRNDPAFEWTPRAIFIASALGVSGTLVGLLAVFVFGKKLGTSVPTTVVTSFGFVGLTVALSGFFTRRKSLRTAGWQLPAIKQSGISVFSNAHRRGFAWRPLGPNYVIVSIGVAILAAVGVFGYVADGGRYNRNVAVILAGLALLTLFAGPASRYVVTQDCLRIESAFVSISIPREMLRSFESSYNQLVVTLTNGEDVSFRVDSMAEEISFTGQRANFVTQVVAARRIAKLLEGIPFDFHGNRPGVVKRGIRPVAVAIAIAVPLLVAVVVLFP